MDISLRLANAADLKAINERYAEVDFVPSHEDELIVLASIGNKIVGQGRVCLLIQIAANSVEFTSFLIMKG